MSWGHFIEILPLKQPLEREYYAELCRVERWSVCTLRERIGSRLYLRMAIARKPETVVQAEISHLRASRCGHARKSWRQALERKSS